MEKKLSSRYEYQKSIVQRLWISRFEVTVQYMNQIRCMKLKRPEIPIPLIYMVNVAEASIIMEYIEGQQMKRLLNSVSKDQRQELCVKIGELIGKLHSHGLIHGDLTTSNMILRPRWQNLF